MTMTKEEFDYAVALAIALCIAENAR